MRWCSSVHWKYNTIKYVAAFVQQLVTCCESSKRLLLYVCTWPVWPLIVSSQTVRSAKILSHFNSKTSNCRCDWTLKSIPEVEAEQNHWDLLLNFNLGQVSDLGPSITPPPPNSVLTSFPWPLGWRLRLDINFSFFFLVNIYIYKACVSILLITYTTEKLVVLWPLLQIARSNHKKLIRGL